MSVKQNCWEAKECGREPGGASVSSMGVCPAAVESDLDGLNEGDQGGRACWVAAGTFCGGTVQGTFAEKVIACLDCEFFEQVREQQGEAFTFLSPGKEYEEVSYLVDEMRTIMHRQEHTIDELMTPVLEVWRDVIVVPLVGVVDTRRSIDVMERILSAISTKGSRYVILDITGVPIVDTRTADHITKVMRAADLLGATSMLTGIQPAVAQTLVEIGVDLASITSLNNVEAALRLCLLKIRAEENAVNVM